MIYKPPLGQHFLKDENVLARLLEEIKPLPDETIVEVGPGLGVLTIPMLSAGSFVRAIELDKKLIAELTKKVAKFENQIVIEQGDAAKTLLVPATGSWRLIGNIPYAISSPLLMQLRSVRERLAEVIIMVQQEFAQRLVAKPSTKTYGRLSVTTQSCFNIEYLFSVSAKAFSPPPKIESAVVRLRPLPKIDPVVDTQIFDALVKTAFAQRRKQLKNTLSVFDCKLNKKMQNLRAENLSVDDYIMLAKRLTS